MSPKVAVILASYNGATFIEAQLKSIFCQANATVSVFVYDDCSTDSTVTTLSRLASQYESLTFVVNERPSGSAFANFYNAIKTICLEEYDYIALSDQDDIWKPNKLESQIDAMSKSSAMASSTSVTAFNRDGKQDYIDNAGQQTEIDYVFTGGGQGCTYLFTMELFCKLQGQVRLLNPVRVPHDWLLYALTRHQGYSWIILNEPLLEYRQHENVFGSRNGFRGKMFRMKMLVSGRFREDRTKLLRYILDDRISPQRFSPVHELCAVKTSLWRRIDFAARFALKFRRSRRQSLVMAVFFVIGWA
jgi:rhamnosyltransferase